MLTKTIEPMISNQVHTTTDYFLFKPIDGNREKNQLHLERLKKSMLENYLFTVLIVNENYEIIDGQHRFEIIKQLGLPLHYVVCKGYGLKEVHILNANSKTWNLDDYLEGYCGLGLREYLLYRSFKNKYKFGHSECVAILTGARSHFSMGAIEKFKLGEFKIASWNNAVDIADKITLVKEYYDGYKRRSFILALLTITKKPEFNFTEFIQKLKINQKALVDCTTTEQYIDLIEQIYNYKRREKVSLKY